jgi:hypothetical protein
VGESKTQRLINEVVENSMEALENVWSEHNLYVSDELRENFRNQISNLSRKVVYGPYNI